MDSLSVPVWRRVDALVVGCTIAAVAAALRFKEEGLSVAILAGETAFGSDWVGTFQLWETPVEEGVLPGISAVEEGGYARPAAVKRFLEQSLYRGGIPFLYGVRPIAFLRDAVGEVGGVVAAARTALFGVRAGTVFDASSNGVLVRLAGEPLKLRSLDCPVRWRVLAPEAPSGWMGEIRTLDSYKQVVDGSTVEFPLFELEAKRSEFGADEKNLAHELRARLVEDGLFCAAPQPIYCGDYELVGIGGGSGAGDFSPDSLRLANGVWFANRLLPARDLPGLAEPFALAVLARNVASAAVKSHRPAAEIAGVGSECGWRFSEAFFRKSEGSIFLPEPRFADFGEADVVVAGGGTGGAPAAIASAREGAETVCLEAGHALGGVGTLGLISSYWFGNKVGFTEELDRAVGSADAISRAKKGNSWNPEVKSATYHRMLAEAGGRAWLGAMISGIRLEGGRPASALVSTPFGTGELRAKFFIDATGNADLAAACGARVRVIGRDHVAVQGAGLSPRRHPGIPHQNSDHTFIDENDPEGLTAAHVQGREKYPDDFDTTPFINTRERRQIRGEYEVSPLDILAGRTFPDTVFTAISNFDTHGFIVHPVFMVVPPDHKALSAHVPLRAMIPAGLEGVLVTGLGVCAHRDALPVIRMQADVQNQGYAAGMLGAELARTRVPVREADIRAFQGRLVGAGILAAEVATHEDAFPLPAESVREAARGPLDNARDVAVIFAHPDIARPELVSRLGDGEAGATAAMILGLMGEPASAPTLVRELENAVWDEGWNYRGMGQFGRCMSRLDALVIALGRTRVPGAGPVLERLAGKLGADAEFSHCRALALAAACLRDAGLERALEGLLDLPGFSGHHFGTLADVLADADGDTTSTKSRNLALREISVARGLYESGDRRGRGRAILEKYSNDLRGHFARHARAVLAGEDTGDQAELA